MMSSAVVRGCDALDNRVTTVPVLAEQFFHVAIMDLRSLAVPNAKFLLVVCIFDLISNWEIEHPMNPEFVCA